MVNTITPVMRLPLSGLQNRAVVAALDHDARPGLQLKVIR
jgi:hypothetical protein